MSGVREVCRAFRYPLRVLDYVIVRRNVFGGVARERAYSSVTADAQSPSFRLAAEHVRTDATRKSTVQQMLLRGRQV